MTGSLNRDSARPVFPARIEAIRRWPPRNRHPELFVANLRAAQRARMPVRVTGSRPGHAVEMEYAYIQIE